MGTNSHAHVLRDLLGGGLRQIFAALGGLVTFAVIARVLERDALGAWQLLGATAFFVGFADLGLSTAVERASVRNDPERTRRTVALALSVMSLVIPLAAMLSYTLVLDVPKGAERIRPEIKSAGLITVAAGALFAWGQPYRFFAVAKGRLRSIAGARMVGSATQALLTIGLVQLTPRVIAPAIGLLLGSLVETALTLRAARSIDPQIPLLPRLGCDRAEVRAALRDGAAGFTVNLAAATALRVDLLVISRVANLATVAAYAAGGRAVELAFLISKQSVVALTPRLGRKAERAAATRLGTLVFAGVIAAGMAALSVVGQGLIVLWAGPVAEGSIPAVAMSVLGLGAFIASTFEVASSTVLLGGRSGWDGAIPFVIGSGINLAISLALSPRFGIWAVAWSTVIGNLVTAALTWRAAMRMLRWSLRDVAALLARAAAPGIAALAVAAPLREAARHHGLASLGASAVACLSGLAVIAWSYRRFRASRALAAEGGG
jgi:O-antigen/teichoic acid export membrane protein